MFLFMILRIWRMLLLVYSMASPLVILLAYWHSIIRQMNASITTFLLFDIHMQLWMNSLVFPASPWWWLVRWSPGDWSVFSDLVIFITNNILLVYHSITFIIVERSFGSSLLIQRSQSVQVAYIFFFFWAVYVPWLILYNMPFREASEGYIYSSHLSSLLKNSTYLQDPYTFIKVFSMHSP